MDFIEQIEAKIKEADSLILCASISAKNCRRSARLLFRINFALMLYFMALLYFREPPLWVVVINFLGGVVNALGAFFWKGLFLRYASERDEIVEGLIDARDGLKRLRKEVRGF